MSDSTQIQRFRHCFDDFDAFTEAADGWNLTFNQLDRGQFHGEMDKVAARAVLAVRCQFDRKLQQSGGSPQGCRTFAVTARDHVPHFWRGHEVGADNLSSWSDDMEMDCVSLPGFHVFGVSVAEELLVAAAGVLGFDSHEEILLREHVVRCSGTHLAELRKLCHAITALSFAGPSFGRPLEDAMQRELPRLLMQCFMSPELQHRAPVSLERRRAVRLAKEALRDAEGPIISVGDLCRLTGVAERTLRYAFAEIWQVPPKVFLMSRRLNAVRRELLRGGEATKIADVANDQGFWHMGQFAADYRRMFGELPSKTLRRSR